MNELVRRDGYKSLHQLGCFGQERVCDMPVGEPRHRCGGVFRCPACKRWVGWCVGCDGDGVLADLCDDCAVDVMNTCDEPERTVGGPEDGPERK